MTWRRLPIFVWGAVSTVRADGARGAGADLDAAHGGARPHGADGVLQPQAGGSPYLYENLFWIFGHPEVYILALPGNGIVLEILPVFARKPLWGYRLAVTGMLGITLLSFLVWQHHLFVSGINADLRPVLHALDRDDLPADGFIFMCALGTLWRARIRLHRADALLPRLAVQLPDRRALRRVPVRHAERRDDARQLLLDGPLPLHDHGRAHLHVLRGDLLLGAEDDRLRVQRAAGEGRTSG